MPSKENLAETKQEADKISQSDDNTMDYSKLTLSEEDALKAQIFTCWSVPIGLPFSEDLLVRVKLELKLSKFSGEKNKVGRDYILSRFLDFR